MNYLALDFGTKTIGLAYSVNDIISTLPSIPNDQNVIPILRKIINDYQISKLYVGLSEGKIAAITLAFVSQLRSMLELPVETVEEAVSTIEASDIYFKNRQPKKKYSQSIDSIAAAVILHRVIN